MRAQNMPEMQVVTNYVRPVRWIGRCPRCGESPPEMRDNPREAQHDIDECPCRYADA